MRQVAREVNHDSAGKQTPALYGLLLEEFALVPGAAPRRIASEPPSTLSTDVALEAWELVKNSNNPADFDEFAKQFPASDHAPLAKLRAAQIRRTTQSSAAAPEVPSIPPVIHFCQSWCNTLTLQGGAYVRTSGGPDNGSTMVIRVEKFTRESVVMHRSDYGNFAREAELTGRISDDGNSIVEGVTGTAPFRLTWGTALDSIPGGGKAPPNLFK